MMVWEKVANRRWQAQGASGTFTIEQSGKLFWGRYASKNGYKAFKMRPAQKLTEAKAQCEDNYYWEDSAEAQ